VGSRLAGGAGRLDPGRVIRPRPRPVMMER